MKHLLTSLMIAAAMLSLLMTSCNSDEDVVYMLPDAKPIYLSVEQQQIRDNNNDFACRLFRTVTEQQEEPGSVILSPISVTYMLGMLSNGATGETLEQITNVLQLGASVQDINEYCKKMIDEAPNIDPGVTLKIANSIDVNSAKDVSLYKQFTQDMEKYYNADINALDFSKSSSLDKINNWCKRNTDGMIPAILNKLDPEAVMYLLNAIYFKATWTDKFDPNDTRDMDFFPLNCTITIVKRQMMHRKALANFCSNDVYEMLCLPYGSNSWGMFVLLPVEGKTVDDIIQSLSGQSIQEQLYRMQPCEVDILMPRFTTSSEIMLEEVLSTMGMPRAFDEFNAQFTNMTESRILYVKAMKQKAVIEVNEEGTKAAAVTMSKMAGEMMPGPNEYQQVDFHATRPFVYVIADLNSLSIFFMGSYCGV